jgi:beta-galactosidase
VENQWALEDAQGYSNVNKKYMDTVFSFYKPLWDRGINTDIISPKDDFSKYKAIILPMLYMVDEKLEAKLCEYVEQGGTLVATYTLATVGENDLCHLGGLPGGRLKDVFGIWNEEIDTLYPEDSNRVKMRNGKAFKAIDYCELIHLQGAEALGEYEEDFYKGYPAFTVNNYGKGKAYYIAFRDEGDFADEIMGHVAESHGITSDFDGKLPDGVTAHSRTDGENIYLFLENYSLNNVTLETAVLWKNAETGEEIKGSFTLPSVTTLILKK